MPAHCEARIPYDAGVAEGMAWRTDVTRRTKSEDVLRCSLLLGLLAGVLPDRLVLAGDGLCFIPNGRDLQRLGQAIVHVSGRTAERVGRLGRRRSVARTWNKIGGGRRCGCRKGRADAGERVVDLVNLGDLGWVRPVRSDVADASGRFEVCRTAQTYGWVWGVR